MRKSLKNLLNDRFWSKVNKNTTTGCWEWTASTQWNGYGQFRSPKGNTVKAHRYSYELENGPINKNMSVLHVCDNPKCVNPSHLFLGTQQDNIKDKVNKNRQLRGEASPTSVLISDQVIKIRNLWDSGNYTQSAISKLFGISNQHVSDIVNRKRWKHL